MGRGRAIPPAHAKVTATAADGSTIEFDARVRIDTPSEADYYRQGGIMPYMLRRLAAPNQ